MTRDSKKSSNSHNSEKHLVQNYSPKILIVPRTSLTNASRETVVIKLRSPKHGTGEMFLYVKDGNLIYHLMKHGEGHQSWFFNDSVYQDGSVTLAVPIDPLFLTLPYMKEYDKHRPLNQILVDNKFPDCSFLLTCDRLLQEISLVATVKETKEFTAYCYNSEKCMGWLSDKVISLANILREKQLHVSLGAQSATFIRNKKESSSSDVDYLKFAFGVVSDYLQDDLALELSRFLRLASSDIDNEPNCIEPPRKRVKLDVQETSEDYSLSTTSHRNVKSTSTKQRKLTGSQKSLSKVDKTGMKKISSFFTTKATK